MEKISKRFKPILSFLLVFVMVIPAFQGAVITASAEDDPSLLVKNLQVEYMTTPLGLDAVSPRFSWVLQSDLRSVKQTGYEITVRQGSESGPVVWTKADSGDETFGVTYAGAALVPSTRYFWTVEVTTNRGAAAGASSWFETGLMGTGSSVWSNAKWITRPGASSVSDLYSYSIEYDLRIVNDNSCFYFAADGRESNCLAWQFCTMLSPNTFYFRPHAWGRGGNGLPIGNYDVAGIVPFANSKNTWLTCRIVVTSTGANSASVATYLGYQGSPLTLINTINRSAALPLTRIGFRQTRDQNVNEISDFDNIKIWNSATVRDSSTLIYEEDFSDAARVEKFFGTIGTVTDGYYHVQESNGVSLRRVVDPAQEGGEPLFRKAFSTKTGKTVKSARLYATARGVYEFSLNGGKVGDDYLAPGWNDYRYQIMYQTYDVTDMINNGENVIGAMLGAGWWSSNQSIVGPNWYSANRSLLGKLLIIYDDGDSDTFVTGTDWQVRSGPVIAADNFDGETYDARYEVPGWNTTALGGTGWVNAVEAAATTSGNAGWTININNVNLYSQIGPGIRKVAEFPVKSLTEPVPGVYVYDFGQNFAGFARIKFKGAAGTTVKMRYAEMLNTEVAYRNPGQGSVGGGDGPIGTLYTASLRSAKVTDYYTLKGDPEGEVWQPTFTFHGFQYLEITGLDEPIPPEDIIGIAITTLADEKTGSFTTSNDMVNKLYDNTLWTVYSNSVGLQTDCPQRDERMGWTDDRMVRTVSFVNQADQFYAKWMLDARTGQLSNGSITDVVPHVHTGNGANGWGDIAVLVPWEMFQEYGDKKIISDAYASMKRWVDFLNNNSSGYIRAGGGYGDWLSPVTNITPQDMFNTLYTAYSVKRFAQMAEIIGNTADAAAYTTRFNNIMAAFKARWVNDDYSLKAGNLAQNPYAMLIYFDLVSPAEKAGFANRLYEVVRDNGFIINTGLVGARQLLPALSDSGYASAAYALLEQDVNPSWMYSLLQGATTIWERWNSYSATVGFGDVGMNSFNHTSFGNVAEWMYTGILGIQRDEVNPGYRHFTLNPQFGGSLTSAAGHYDSVSGTIKSGWNWDQTTGDIVYSCTVPANTTATVRLPVTDGIDIYEGDILAADSEGVEFKGMQNGRAVFELGSGDYTFTTRMPAPPKPVKIGVTVGTGNLYAKITSQVADNAPVVRKGSDFMDVGLSAFTGDSITLTAEPYNNVDFVFDRWEDADGNTVSTNPVMILDNLTEDADFKAYFKWVGYSSIIRGLPPAQITTRQALDDNNASFGKANLVDGGLIGYPGMGGWSSGSVGQNPTGTSQPYIQFDAGTNNTFSFNRLLLYPRSDDTTPQGGTPSFPVRFTISGSNNGTTFTNFVDYSTTDYPAPDVACPAVFSGFGQQSWRYIRVTGIRMGTIPITDSVYRMQLRQVGVYNLRNLTVSGGTGSGTYDAGAQVEVTANPPPAGYAVFDKWLADGFTLTPQQQTSGSFTLTVPNSAGMDISLTATYKKDISTDGRVVIWAEDIPGAGDPSFNPRFGLKANDDIALSLYVAAYSAGGKLVALSSAGVALSGGDVSVLQAAVPSSAGLTYKFFIWDDKFIPLTAITAIDGL